MMLLTVFSGIGISALILAFIFSEKRFIREYWLRMLIGLILLISIFTVTLILELNAKDKVEITERTIVTDYLEVNMYTTLKFSEPMEVKVVEYDYPGYSLLNNDKTVYEVMK